MAEKEVVVEGEVRRVGARGEGGGIEIKKDILPPAILLPPSTAKNFKEIELLQSRRTRSSRLRPQDQTLNLILILLLNLVLKRTSI